MWTFSTRRNTRPSPKKEAWMPKRAGPPDPGAEVDPKFRGLKLRKRRARYTDTQGVGLVVFATMIACLLILILYRQLS